MNDAYIIKVWLLISERFPYCKYCPKEYNSKKRLFMHMIGEHEKNVTEDHWYQNPFELTKKEIYRLGEIESICYKDCKCICHEKEFRKFLRHDMRLLNCKVCGHILDDFLQNRDCHHKEKKK